MCDDSFPYITKKIPVLIGSKSDVAIKFESNSVLEEVYIESLNTKYFEHREYKSDSYNPEDVQFSKRFNKLNYSWEPKPDFEQYVLETSDSSGLRLLAATKQNIKNTYFDGQYIISVGSWWADGDASFKILVKGRP